MADTSRCVPRTVWQLWQQPDAAATDEQQQQQMPPIIADCTASWSAMATQHGWQHRLLRSVDEVVQVIDAAQQLVMWNPGMPNDVDDAARYLLHVLRTRQQQQHYLCIEHCADLVKLLLLWHCGGMWVDASVQFRPTAAADELNRRLDDAVAGGQQQLWRQRGRTGTQLMVAMQHAPALKRILVATAQFISDHLKQQPPKRLDGTDYDWFRRIVSGVDAAAATTTETTDADDLMGNTRWLPWRDWKTSEWLPPLSQW